MPDDHRDSRSIFSVSTHLRIEPVLRLDVSEEEAKNFTRFSPVRRVVHGRHRTMKTLRNESDTVQPLIKRTAGERLWEILHRNNVG
jgi:hypothetical protein